MLALITGASSGIGLMYAHELAHQGHELLLVSNQEKELETAATTIKQQFGVSVNWFYLNLAEPNAAETLHKYCVDHQFKIDILINNAGVFFFNELINTDMHRVEMMLSLHVITMTKLCKLFGEEMKQRKHGYMLNMSSMSAWMSMPGIQTYNATKAYILNFSRSLWYELKPYGVTVTAICPGAVDTGLYGLKPSLRKLAVKLGVAMPPEKLVKMALTQLYKGKKQALPGRINQLFIPLIKHLPDWAVFAIMKRIYQFQK